MESREIEVLSYGHQQSLEKADEFYAKEEPGQEYGDDDIMDFEDMNFQPIDLQGDQAEYQEVEKLNNLMELDPDTFEGQIFDTKTDFNKFNMDDMETDFE